MNTTGVIRVEGETAGIVEVTILKDDVGLERDKTVVLQLVPQNSNSELIPERDFLIENISLVIRDDDGEYIMM